MNVLVCRWVGREITLEKLASVTDYTNLKADATPDNITKLCGEGKKHRFASVCVNSSNVRQAASELRAQASNSVPSRDSY